MSKVVIVGLGRSGIAAARLIAERGDSVYITELKEDDSIISSVEILIEDNVAVKDNVEIGSHSERFIKDADLMIVSPGVRRDALPVRLAEERNLLILSELELAYSMCHAPIIAVTGTSGKTTVTTLIGRMLKEGGLDAVVCGNIGNPLSGELNRIKRDSIVVLEVSSFQLEWIRNFRPGISIILNISENHLDRHKDMEEYISLKGRIFSNQDERDLLLLNGKDKSLRRLSSNIKPRVEFFDEYKDFSNRYKIGNEDYLAAMTVASLYGISEDTMMDVISHFKGLEHRLEHVTTVRGVDFVNDSKATTVSSVAWALRSLNGRIRLIMGGRYKGGDFKGLNYLVREKVDSVIVIGEAGSMIKEALGSFEEVIQEDTLARAVHSAFKDACKGDKVLFSPGCSSFDMFKNYEERGRVFKDICLRLPLI